MYIAAAKLYGAQAQGVGKTALYLLWLKTTLVASLLPSILLPFHSLLIPLLPHHVVVPIDTMLLLPKISKCKMQGHTTGGSIESIEVKILSAGIVKRC